MKKKGSRPVATKVNDYVKERLGRLCAKKGFTEYELLQMMCDCAVRYMDDAHNLSADMEQLMVTFEHMNGWADAFNLADPTVGREIGEAFYVTKDPAGNKHGQRCTRVYNPYFGEWQQSENVVNIFERFLELLFPERYERLRHLTRDMGCYSILETIDTLMADRIDEMFNQELRRDFEDCNRSDNTRDVEYGQRTKRVPHHTVDSVEPQQQRISFEEDLHETH